MAKTKPKKDEVREERITMEIIVDAYNSEEQAMGWYYYLEEELKFPFTAICSSKRAISPLRIKDEVAVIGMAPEDECEREMFVMLRWEIDGFAGQLSQLTPIKSVNEHTKQAVRIGTTG